MNRHQQLPNHFESSPAPRIASRAGAGMYAVSPLVCPVSSTSTPVRGEMRSVNATHSAQITHPQSCYQVNNCTSGYVDSNGTTLPSFSTTNARLGGYDHENASTHAMQFTTPIREPVRYTPYLLDLSGTAQEHELGSVTPRRMAYRNTDGEARCWDDELEQEDGRQQNEKPVAMVEAASRWQEPLCTDMVCKVRGNPFSPPPCSYSKPTYDPSTMRRVLQDTCPSPDPNFATSGILDRGLPFIERLELNWLKFRTKPYYHYRLHHSRENPEREAVIQRNSRKYFEWLNSNQSSTNPCASPALFRIDENANADAKGDPHAVDEYVCDYLRTMSDAALLSRDPDNDSEAPPPRHSLLDFVTTAYMPTLHPTLCKAEPDRTETKQKRTVCTQTAVTIPADIDLVSVIDFYLKKQAEYDRDTVRRRNEQPVEADTANDGFREQDLLDNEPPATSTSSMEHHAGDTPRAAHVDTSGNSHGNGHARGSHLRRSRSSRNAVRPRKLYHAVDECDEQSNEAWHSGISQNSSNTSPNSSVETVKSNLASAPADCDDPDLRCAHIIASSSSRPFCSFASPVCPSSRPDDVDMCGDDEVITGNGIGELAEPLFESASPFGAFDNMDRFSSPCPAGFPAFAAKCRIMATPTALEDRFALTQMRDHHASVQSNAASRTEPFSVEHRNDAASPSLVGRPLVNSRPTSTQQNAYANDSFDVSMADGAATANISAELTEQPHRKWNCNRQNFAS